VALLCVSYTLSVSLLLKLDMHVDTTTCEAVVFVIDSTDERRLEEALEELYLNVQDDNLCNLPLLLLTNKQDLPGALSTDELLSKINLEKITKGREWRIEVRN
jgi:GTPase SAR1 family protein